MIEKFIEIFRLYKRFKFRLKCQKFQGLSKSLEFVKKLWLHQKDFVFVKIFKVFLKV